MLIPLAKAELLIILFEEIKFQDGPGSNEEYFTEFQGIGISN